MHQTQHPGSMEELARIVGRDLKNVQRDICDLDGHGLIRMSQGGRIGKCRASVPEAPFDEIVLKVAI